MLLRLRMILLLLLMDRPVDNLLQADHMTLRLASGNIHHGHRLINRTVLVVLVLISSNIRGRFGKGKLVGLRPLLLIVMLLLEHCHR